MLSLADLKKIYANEKEEILKDYFTFLRFESIATDPNFRPQVNLCADWVKDYLIKIGMKVEKWETKNAPTLLGNYDGGGTETLLLYCHYDVQPVDPLNLWTTPPFEPTIREGKVYARGAVDNKGQCFYTLRALKTLLEKEKPKLKIKFLIEGEEESGSTGLHGLLKEKKKELQADHILIVDAGLEKANTPAICLGVRGLICMEVTLQGSKGDLHSGSYGGIVYNPNRALVELLSSLHDQDGHVTIPGFYDDVRPITEEEKKKYQLTFDLQHFKKHFEAEAIGMEKGLSPLESSWLRPTAEINGVCGGYTGPGFKTVIPAKASAKLSFRLVPDQDPEKIVEHVKKHLEKQVPKGIEIKVEIIPGKGKPFRASPTSKIAKTMSQAYSEVFGGLPCAQILLGGSIPISSELAETAGAEMIFVGVGLPEDQIHAPDEHFSLDRLEQGYLTICRGIMTLGAN